MDPLPLELQQAIEEGELTDEQLRELITLEAEALGLTFKEFRQAGRAITAPLATRFGPLRLHLQIGRHALSLNDLHLPTGYVPVEEVLRFCIADLGVRPRSREWNRILLDSTLVTA